MYSWCVAAFLVAVALPNLVISQETCTGGKVFQECGSACPPTCENPSPSFCTFQCVRGCACPSGIGLVERSDGQCVNITQCTTATPTTPPVPTCPNGKVYVQCMNTCPVTCTNPTPPICTSFVCISGCECPRGLALHNDQCIRPEECPSTASTTAAIVRPTQPTCPSAMTYNSCGTACPLTCEHPDPRPCFLICSPGCFCPLGLLQHNGQCITREQCPSTASTTAATIHPTQPTCPSAMTYNSCGTACPLTCEHPYPRPCIRICSPGCFCPTGLLQHNGQCITREQCPSTSSLSPPTTTEAPSSTAQPTCSNNRIYSTCGTACPITCANYRNPPLICPAICRVGCFCPTGLIQDGDRCVTAAQCGGGSTVDVTTIPPPTEPTCPSGMTFNRCGTHCPLTCQEPMVRPCIRSCNAACFCPNGLLQNNGTCVLPAECPSTSTTAVTVPATPTCPTGMIFKTCGPICRVTCTPNNFCFSLRCAPGCFCPDGMYEHEGQCISECPSTTTTPTTEVTRPPVTTPACTNGRVYTTCGSACPLTCATVYAPPRPCPLICVRGCFCPHGTVADGNRCVDRDQCTNPCASVRCPSQCVVDTNGRARCAPDCRVNNGNCSSNEICVPNNYTCTPGRYCNFGRFVNCTTNPCATKACSANTRCVVSNKTRTAICVPSCENNGGCNSDEACEIRTYGCGQGSRQPCDSTFIRLCKVAPYVPCGQDAFLACDSEWTYCLQQNITRRASCVASCLSRNGNCKGSSVCVTTIKNGSPTLQCLDRDELPSDCPAGQVMDQCGNACQATCDTHLKGPKICPLICGPPACVCPQHLVLFRDRCVDPRLCYILTKYPPPVSPLPVVNGKSVLLNIVTSHVTQEAFDTVQSDFLSSVQETLSSMTNNPVQARLHGTYTNTTSPGAPVLVIVVEVSGDHVSRDSAQAYANILNQNTHLLIVEIDKVEPQEVVYVDGESSSSQGLSNTAIIGIAVGSAVVGLCFVAVWIALVACCCIANRRMSTKRCREQPPTPTKALVFHEMSPEESDFAMDPNKGKLIKESLMY